MYSIWAVPTTKDARYLLQIICKLGKKYDTPTFYPHITVFSGIRSSSVAKTAIKNCTDIKKFTVNTMDVAFSNNLWKTVFINVEKNQKLKQIHNIIKKNTSNSKYEFNPHISLIYKKLDDSKKQEIIDSLKIKRKLTFDKITIIASYKDVKKWKVVDRVILK